MIERDDIIKKMEDDLCYEHNTNSRSPYYNQWVISSDKGAVDIMHWDYYDTDQYIVLDFGYRSVSKKFAKQWTEKYLGWHNLTPIDIEISEGEKNWIYADAKIKVDDIIQRYKDY